MPIPLGLREMWKVIGQSVKGRAAVAREREDRTTAETVMRGLEGGGLWMDHDGQRVRLIIRPTDQISQQSAPTDILPLLERGNDVNLDQ